MSVSQEQLTLLRQFVEMCKKTPSILHLPQLVFYKEWLESMGGKIPPKTPTSGTGSADTFNCGDAKPECCDHQHKTEPMEEDKPKPPEEETVESEDSEESELELDNEGVIDGDHDPPLEIGDSSLDVTDELMEQSSSKRAEAMEAANDGRLDEAIDKYTEAIKLNPLSAALFAKRASVLIRLKKPNAAIIDCDYALQLNTDSAQAYKWRGKAKRMIGDWVGAYNDLNTANRIDYDDSIQEMLKEVAGNAKKILEHKRRYERHHDERDIRKRKERVLKARKEYERKKSESSNDGGFSGGMPGGFPGGMPAGFPGGMPGGFPGGMPGGFPGGMPSGASPGGASAGGMPDLNKLFNDPELMAALQDPEVMAAFQDVSKNPANISKYENNPKIKNVINKMSNKFGGSSGAAGSESSDS